MFLAVIADDIGAAVRLIAEEFLARCLFERVHDFFGEAVRISGLSLVRDDPCNLPVSYSGILACGYFADSGVRTYRGRNEVLGVFICFYAGIVFAVDREKSHFRKIRESIVGVREHCCQCVAACISEFCGIRCAADTKTVQNYKKNTFSHISLHISD